MMQASPVPLQRVWVGRPFGKEVARAATGGGLGVPEVARDRVFSVKSTVQASDQTQAVLFCRLAQLVVWGQQHSDVRARYPELDRLLAGAAAALARVEDRHSASSGHAELIPFPDSQSMV